MKKLILALCSVLWLVSSAWATNYCSDANNKGCWGMEDSGNESDLSSNGVTLTETSGTIPQSADKKFGTYSRDFESGDTEYLIEAADGSATDITGANQNMSICAWVKPESVPSAGNRVWLAAKWNATGQHQYGITIYDRGGGAKAEFSLSFDGDTFNYDAVGATTLSTATWYHICGVYNDTDMRLYLNGSVDTNGASNPLSYNLGIANKSAKFTTGTSEDLGSYFDGLIDDVCLFNRELSSAEVSDIYTNGCGGSAGASRRRPPIVSVY